MNTHASLFDAFMKEFCPPLDSSLVAAFLVDIEVDNEGRRTSPTQSQINELRSILRELAAQADELQLSEFSDLHLASPTDTSSSIPDFLYDQTDTNSSLFSETSVSSQDALSSQLRFLQTALPNISEKRLRNALAQAELDDDEPDLWSVISDILTDEGIRELEERGLEGLGDVVVCSAIVADIPRETVEARKPKNHTAGTTKSPGKKPKRGHKITLVDIRQQHHARPNSPQRNPASPWAMVMSISEQLSNLIPSHPASYFQSYFHSPKYSTPYEALRSALGAINVTNSTSDAEDTAVLFTLLDILLPEYEGMLDSTYRSKFYSDLQLVINVTRGHADDALDLVRILRELDSDSMSGSMEMGIYHSPIQANFPSPSSPSSTEQSLRYVPDLRTEPPPILSPPNNKGKPPLSEKKRKLVEPQWQTVLQKNYSTKSGTGPNVKGWGNALGKGGKGDVGELAEYNIRIKEIRQKRDVYFREAQRMWRKGNVRNRGGEVALYYVERVCHFSVVGGSFFLHGVQGRKLEELAKKEALNAARARVQAKR
ncbi:hypothetical protein AX15_003545 [Amanita polypyramis BW_CC]|nr:hypothetical protein AX15_003545 [Amanita polypyramis BW_CC]